MESLSPFLQGSFIPCFMPVYPGAPQHSTGPSTDEGKAASSMNALKTGIHAKSLVLPSEKLADLQLLIDEYYQCHHPTTPEARALIDELIRCEWLQRRLHTAETQLWAFDAKDAWTLWKFGYETNWPTGADPKVAAGDVNIYLKTAEFVVHPPLGKWIISLGMWALGPDNPRLVTYLNNDNGFRVARSLP